MHANKVIAFGKNFTVVEGITGVCLADYLQETNDFSMLIKYLEELIKAHKKRIILGDRHARNTILGEKLNHIDFDLELLSTNKDFDKAKCYEIAEAIFESIIFLPRKDILFDNWAQVWHTTEKQGYPTDTIDGFLRGFMRYYSQRIAEQAFETKEKEKMHKEAIDALSKILQNKC